jgi:uncharacterized protein (TIGR00255 family)
MNSMTGFGRSHVPLDQATVEFTLSCVNKRGLEININLPRELAGMEMEFSEALRKHFERGKVQLNVRTENFSSSTKKSHERFEELRKACKAFKVPFTPDAALVCQLMNAPASTCAPMQAKSNKALNQGLEEAIAACKKAQCAEGKRLEKDFALRLEKLSELVLEASEVSRTSVGVQRERLLKNLNDAGLNINPNDERILKELALFADRVDIAEELTRIKSHLQALAVIIKKNPSGRQIEFLLQELLREWNTLGNKSQILALIQTALAAKNEVERLREQAANIA